MVQSTLIYYIKWALLILNLAPQYIVFVEFIVTGKRRHIKSIVNILKYFFKDCITLAHDNGFLTSINVS